MSKKNKAKVLLQQLGEEDVELAAFFVRDDEELFQVGDA